MTSILTGAFIFVVRALSGLTTTEVNCYKSSLKGTAGPGERPLER